MNRSISRRNADERIVLETRNKDDIVSVFDTLFYGSIYHETDAAGNPLCMVNNNGTSKHDRTTITRGKAMDYDVAPCFSEKCKATLDIEDSF